MKIFHYLKKEMVNTRCLCPVAASTNQVGALSLSVMVRY